MFDFQYRIGDRALSSSPHFTVSHRRSAAAFNAVTVFNIFEQIEIENMLKLTINLILLLMDGTRDLCVYEKEHSPKFWLLE